MKKLNVKTPMAKVLKIIRIRGRQPRRVTVLHSEGEYFTTVGQNAGKMAGFFADVSSYQSYAPEFQRDKAVRERTIIDFQSDNSEIYNKESTYMEFETALQNTKDTAPRREKANYKMIKCLSEASKATILEIMNRLWTHSYMPPEWKPATVITIVKPGKHASKPERYRQISLTSCL